MKLKIPPEIQIGAHTFRIRWSDKVLRAVQARAHESCVDQIIRLHHDQTASATFESLLHEMDHVVSYVFGIEAAGEEEAIVARAAGFTQALMSMGIEPDFSDIPEERLDEEYGVVKPGGES